MPTILIVAGVWRCHILVCDLLASKKSDGINIRVFVTQIEEQDDKFCHGHLEKWHDNIQAMVGDLHDRGSLRNICKGVDIAFVETFPKLNEDILGMTGQVEEGRGFIETAKECGISHIVFGPWAGAELACGVPSILARYRIEEIIRSSGLAWTILRPADILDFLVHSKMRPSIELSRLASIFGNTKKSFVSSDVYSQAIVAALLDPKQHLQKSYDLVMSTLTVDDILDQYQRIEGKRPLKIWIPRWYVWSTTRREVRPYAKWEVAIHKSGMMPSSPADALTLVPNARDVEKQVWTQSNLSSARLNRQTGRDESRYWPQRIGDKDTIYVDLMAKDQVLGTSAIGQSDDFASSQDSLTLTLVGSHNAGSEIGPPPYEC